ncbi:hypothetical protein GBA52_015045 [Prunus armeniaca]|nr:hypothetical protein GBA52_015045 [Prunus armeniaca]
MATMLDDANVSPKGPSSGQSPHSDSPNNFDVGLWTPIVGLPRVPGGEVALIVRSVGTVPKLGLGEISSSISVIKCTNIHHPQRGDKKQQEIQEQQGGTKPNLTEEKDNDRKAQQHADLRD